MRAYKSLKGYQYYSDGYVQNVWISPITETGMNGASSNDLLIVKCHYFSSLKASTTGQLEKQGTGNGTGTGNGNGKRKFVRSCWDRDDGQLEKQGTGNGTGTGTGTGNENLREAAGAETTRSSRLLSSREPRTSRSTDSR